MKAQIPKNQLVKDLIYSQPGKYNISFWMSPIATSLISKVYLGYDFTSKKLIVVKQYFQNRSVELDQMKRLFQKLDKNHPNIVFPYSEPVKSTFSDTNYVFMDFCNMGTLQAMLRETRSLKGQRKLQYSQACTIMKDIVSGYQQLFQNNIAHGDLSLTNILIHDNVFRISDFDSATSTKSNQVWKSFGTVKFMPPERLDPDQVLTLRVSTSADIFSLGCIFYQLTEHHKYFDTEQFRNHCFQRLYRGADQKRQLHTYITQSDFKINFQNSQTSPELKQLIARMLKKNPADRPDFPTVKSLIDSLPTPGERHKYEPIQISSTLINSIFFATKHKVLESQIEAIKSKLSIIDEGRNEQISLLRKKINDQISFTEILTNWLAQVQLGLRQRFVELECEQLFKAYEQSIWVGQYTDLLELHQSFCTKSYEKADATYEKLEKHLDATKAKCNEMFSGAEIQASCSEDSYTTTIVYSRNLLQILEHISESQLLAVTGLVKTLEMLKLKRRVSEGLLEQLNKPLSLESINMIRKRYGLKKPITLTS